MTEIEEDIYEKVFHEDDKEEVVLDRGCTPYQIDWDQLPGWKEKMIGFFFLFQIFLFFLKVSFFLLLIFCSTRGGSKI